MKRVAVHIDRLVLHGFKDADPRALAAGMQQELTRPFPDSDTAGQWVSRGSLQRLKVGGVRMGSASKPDGIGTQAAYGIAREIRS
jgi:hypothetical protein